MDFTKQKESDNYYSKKEVWEKIEQYIPKDKVIYEPFYGDGKSGQYLRELGFNVIHEPVDFFENNFQYDIIVSNMPFSLRKKIFTRLKELGKPFVMVMFPIVLSCKWFLDLFDDIQIIIPKKRVKCYGNGKENYTPNGGLWYFCWKMNLPKELIII
jgi:hypothetical protein